MKDWQKLMTHADPWAELERLAKLQTKAMRSGDEDMEYDCKLARMHLEREIRDHNLRKAQGLEDGDALPFERLSPKGRRF